MTKVSIDEIEYEPVKNNVVDVAWSDRLKLRAEGDKLYAKGHKLRAEGEKIYAEGEKLRAEGDKLSTEGDFIFFEAVISTYGNIKSAEDTGDYETMKNVAQTLQRVSERGEKLRTESISTA